MKAMGEIISGKRKEHGMTQAELAAKMNVTDKAVSKWERNLSCPDINSISTLAAILDISVNELLDAKIETPVNSKTSEIGKMINLILKAVSLAMGVATVVASIMDKIDTKSALIMLGIGLGCLGLLALTKDEK